ncbi:MAG: mannosyltransferase family protein [Chthoniobacterales bacterium]
MKSEDSLPTGSEGRIRRLLRDRSVRAALFFGILSRIIVLLIFLGVGWMRTAPDFFPGHTDATISARRAPIHVLRQEVLTADVNWSVGIAEHGYQPGPFSADAPRNWAFFPLFPMILHLVSHLTGEFVLTGMGLSHLFFLLGLFLLHRLCLSFGLTADAADRCVTYLAFFPTSYFFSLPLTEALFLVLTVGSFYLAKQERWWLAGLVGAFASATRTAGVLLLPALAILYWQTHRPLRPLRREILAPLLVPVGLVCFMIYLKVITGNPFAFRDTMAVWGREAGFFLGPLYDYLRHPSEIAAHWDFRLLNFLAAVFGLIAGGVLVGRRQFALGAYTLLSVLLALSSSLLQSQARYMMVVFPVYLVLATWTSRPKIHQMVFAILLVLFGLMTALFAAHFTLALS